MVHEKFIKRGGKTFGPYIYETKRVDGKVVTSYIGKGRRKNFIPYLAIVLFLLFLVLIGSYNKEITGSVIFEKINDAISESENIGNADSADNAEKAPGIDDVSESDKADKKNADEIDDKSDKESLEENTNKDVKDDTSDEGKKDSETPLPKESKEGGGMSKDDASEDKIRKSDDTSEGKIRKSTDVATEPVKNESYINESEEILINTTQFKAILGQPVKWIKKIENVKGPKTIFIELPKSANNISITKIKEKNIREKKNEKIKVDSKGELKKEEEKDPQKTAVDSEEKIVSGAEKGLIFSFFTFIKNIPKITGLAVLDKNPASGKKFGISVDFDESETGAEIEYYTDAPSAVEEETAVGKKVKVSSPDDVHYENVLIFTNLPESLNVVNKNRVRIYWEEKEIELEIYKITDRDENGLYDYLEFVAPQLSNQTFSIIVITKAEHLDENRTFISDIYKQVKELDGNWSEEIPNEHFVRVTFERNLTSENDITIYPRTLSGKPRIEVYEINGTEVIAEFGSLIDNEYNKVFLTNLNGSQDSFDLRILNGEVQFDHIIDPLPSQQFFEDCTDLTDWTLVNGPTSGWAAGTGGDAGWCKASNTDGSANMTSSAIALNGANGANLTFNRSTAGLDSGEYLRVWVNSSTEKFRLVVSFTDNTATNHEYDLTKYINLTAGVRLLAECSVSATNENCMWDNINVTASFPDSTPPRVTINQPQNATLTPPILFNVTLDEQGSAVNYTLSDGSVNYTMVANPAGTGFNATNTSIADGSYIVRYYAWDTAGNLNGTETRTFSVDTTAPLVTIVRPANITYSSFPIPFNISTNENSTANYTLNNGATNYTMTANASGTGFNATNTSIADGGYTVRYYVWDTSNNLNGTETRAFSVDATFPLVSIAFPGNTSYNTNVSALNYTVSDANLQTCWYSLNNGATNTTITCGNNATGLASSEGSNTWRVYVNDTSGNANSSSITFSKDTIIPSVQFVSPTLTGGSTQLGTSITVNVTATDTNLANITIFLYNSTSLVNSTTTTTSPNFVNITGLADGIYYFNATTRDTFNNQNNTETRNVTIDTTNPAINYVSPTENSGISVNRNYIEVNVTATDANLQTILIRLYNSTSNQINSSTTTTSPNYINYSSLSDGLYFYNATANDTLGNLANLETRNITLDRLFPLVSIAFPGNTSYNTNVSALNYTVSDANLQTCWYSLNNGATNTTITCGNNATGLASSEGSNTWRVYVNDTSGNANSSSITFSKDTIIPSVQFVSPAETDGSFITRNHILVNVTATDTNLNSILIRLYNSTSNQINSSLTASSPDYINFSGLSDGIYYFNATANDTLNNVNNTATRNVTIDTINPSASGFIETPSDPAAYSSNAKYEFNATVTDANLDKVLTEFNGVNYSATKSGNVYNFSISNLAVGTYNYYWRANDSAGNVNMSDTFTYTINRAASEVNLTLNNTEGNITISTGTAIYLNATLITGDAGSGIQLYNNGTLINNGTSPISNLTTFNTLGLFNITTIYPTSQNYTSSSETFYVNVTGSLDNEYPIFTNFNETPANNSIYTNNAVYRFNVTITSTNGSAGLEFNGTNYTATNISSVFNVSVSNLAAGAYNYYWFAWGNGTNKNYNLSGVRGYTVAKATGDAEVYLNGNTANITVELGNSATINASRLAGEVNIDVYLDNALIATGIATTNTTTINSMGSKNVTAILSLTQNYTVDTQTRWIDVIDTTKPLVSIVIPENISYTAVQTALNYTASDLALQTCWYSLNNGATNTTITCGNNATGLASSEGSNTWRVYVNDTSGNANSSSVTFSVDSIFPTIQFVSPTETNNSFLARNSIPINVTATDTNLANITIFLYNSTSLVNSTTTTTSPNFVNITGLADGTYYFNASARDTFNKINSTETRTITIDTVNPSVSYVSPTQDSGISVNRNYIEVNVTATDANLQTILIRLYNSTNNQINSSTTTTSPNYINFSGLSDGLYFYNATANDSIGNLANLGTRNITLDRLFPLVSIAFPGNTSYNTNVSALNYTVSDANLQTCWYSLNNGATNTTITCGNNATGLASSEGSNTWRVYVNDTSGNANSSSITFSKDTIIPSVQFVSPTLTGGTSQTSTSITVNVTATDTNLANITIFLYNSTNNQINSSLTATSPDYINFSGLSEGIYYFNATARDTFNNQNNTETRNVTIDATNPVINYVSPTQDSGISVNRNYIEVNVTATDANLQTILIRLYNSTNNQINSSTTTTSPNYINFSGLSDGLYFYNATANDSIGNLANLGTRNITLDRLFPLVSIAFPGNTSYNTNVSALNYTVSDANLQTCWYSLNNGATNTTITCGNNATGLASSEGSNTWRVYVNDTSGNANSSSITFSKDTIIPSVQFVSPAETDGSFITRNHILVNATATDTNLNSILIRLYNSTNNQINSSTTATSPNYVNFSGLSDGIYYFNATANDTLNNVNNTATRNVTIDTTKPLVSFVAPTQNNGANVSANSIFVNVTVTETNEVNITFRFHNTTSAVNVTTYSTAVRTINWTGLADGIYTYNVTIVDLALNSNATETRTITLDTIFPTFSNIQESPSNNSAYQTGRFYEFNVSVTDANIGTVFIEWNGTNYTNTYGAYQFNRTGLAAGTYAYRWYANDSAGNLNSTTTNSYSVAKAVPQGNILNSTALSVVYPTETNFSTNETNTGDGDVTYTLYKNNVSVGTSETKTLAVGTYVYLFNATQGTNYTANSSIDTETLTVQQGAGLVHAFLNHSRTNITIQFGTSIYLNATLISGSGIIQLYNNGTLINNGTSPLSNLTLFNDAGLYNITAVYSGNENYTSSSETWFANVTPDITSPIVTINLPGNITYSSNDFPLTFNVSLNENGSIVMYTLDNGINNITMNTTDNLAYTAVNESMADGSYTFKVYANDTSGNRNDSASVVFSVSGAGESGGQSSGGGGGGGGNGLVETDEFTLDKDLIHLELKQGNTYREAIGIKNTGSSRKDFELKVENVERFVILSEEKFRLSSGESKEINADFFVKDNEPADIYAGRIIVEANSIIKPVTVIIEVKEINALFDVKSEIQSDVVRKGQKIKAKINLLEVGDLDERVDVLVEYFIQDLEGNLLKLEEETVGVYKNIEIERNLKIPESVEPGDYLFYVRLTYLGNVVTSGNRITITEGFSAADYLQEKIADGLILPLSDFLNKNKFVIIVVLLSAALFFGLAHRMVLKPLGYRLRVFYLREIYKINLLKAEYGAGLLEPDITAIKHLPRNIVGSADSAFYKIYAWYLRVKYDFSSIRAKYEAGIYDEEILALERLPQNLWGAFNRLIYRVYAFYLRVKYRILHNNNQGAPK